jgi:hypothetical protein
LGELDLSVELELSVLPLSFESFALFECFLLLEEPLESLPMLLDEPLPLVAGLVALESEPDPALLLVPELLPLLFSELAAEVPPLLEPEPVLLEEPDCAAAGRAANPSNADP